MALGMFFATSLDVNRVYWFGPLMYPFLTAFMNVVGEENRVKRVRIEHIRYRFVCYSAG